MSALYSPPSAIRRAMALPQVVIVGRPNVGKSSLFNWLARKRLAIVDDMAGVTRDRQSFTVEHEGRYFDIVDTGGMGIEDVDQLTREVEQQIDAGMRDGHMMLMVVDTQAGITALDQTIAQRLHRIGKPVLLVANKADSPRWDSDAEAFVRLGFGRPLITSTRANRNRLELIEAILPQLPAVLDDRPETEPEMKLAIVGRRNVGKSTFVNTLAQSDRMIVSEVAGTTRDSVDVRFELDGRSFVAIDTPGLRRAGSFNRDIDFYGSHRAHRSIRRADVVLAFFDANEPISKVDRQLCNYIAAEHKPCIFVVNKWDMLLGKAVTGQWAEHLQHAFTTMKYAPIAFITAKTGKNVKTLINHAQMLFKQSRQRVATAGLNELLQRALKLHPPPLYQQRLPKIYYGTQIDIQPPTIALFCSNPKAFSEDYRRYLLSVFRDHLPFGEVPIRLFLQPRKKDGAERTSRQSFQSKSSE